MEAWSEGDREYFGLAEKAEDSEVTASMFVCHVLVVCEVQSLEVSC
jgi:hypothetical protein